MRIARIVSSNSHIDYIGRIIDEFDAEESPRADDYGFGQFVSITAEPETIVGVIYDSKLINPEYGSYGPRLSPRPALGNFSPDYLSEQGVLIGILLLGVIGAGGSIVQGVPRSVVPPGQDVFAADDDLVQRFHADPQGGTHLHYFSQVMSHAGPFAVPLLEAIIDRLAAGCTDGDRQRLGVLKQSLSWQRTMGGIRF